MVDVVNRVFGSDTNGEYSIVEVTSLPGGRPLRYSHANGNERFIVLEGIYRFWFGDEGDPYNVRAGASVYCPRNIFHRFQNISEGPSKMIIVFTPAGRGEYSLDFTQTGKD